MTTALEPTAPAVRFPLATKLTLAFSLIALVPLVATGLYVYDVNRTMLRVLLQHLMAAVADEVATAADAGLRDAEDDLEAIGRLLVDESLPPETAERLALARLEGASALDHVVVWDAAGRTVAVAAEREAASGRRPPEVLSAELRTEADRSDTAIGDVVREDGEIRVLIVIPVRSDGETITGYLGSLAILAGVADHVRELRDEHFGDVNDAITIIDDTGATVATSRVGTLADSDAALRAGVLSQIPGGDALVGGWSGRFSGEGGVERVALVRPVFGRPFRVVVQVPVEVAFGSLDAVRRAVAVAVAVAVLLALLAGVVVARGITRPLRALVELAGHLGARRFDRRAVLRTRDELAVLGHSMSEAARGLEESEARVQREVAIRADLGRYIPAEIVERVVRREQDMALGGSRRSISVIFADVVAFTPLTARLEPEVTVRILNELFTILTEIVFRNGGTVDKFIGDSVMAIFGAPSDQPDHAARAVRTAEEMLRWLETGNVGWQERHGVRIELAIGVSTGDAVVGNIGSETRMEYTAIGDTVNVAARLEAIARPQQILVTNATKVAADTGEFDFFDVGERQLPGREGTMQLWEVSS